MPAVFEKLGEGAAIGRELGDDAIVERFMVADGYMAFMTDDLERARSLLEQGLELTERRGDRMAIATGNHTVAQVARLQGRLDDAANHYLRSLTGLHDLGDVASLTEPLQGLAAVAVATGRAELGVRLAMLTRRSGGAGEATIRLGPLAIDTDTYQVVVAGRVLDLTYKEFELLRFLVQRPGRVFTRTELLSQVWGYNFYGGTRTVDVHVRRLRAKLGPEHESIIQTVRGVGYRAAEPRGDEAER